VNQATLRGCRAKVDRADEAIHEMADKWGKWVDPNPYPAWIDADPRAGRYRLGFDFSVRPPPEFAVRAGEIAYDLRSALDHLIWREAIEHLRRVPTDKVGRRIMFPLLPTRTKFERFKKSAPKQGWSVQKDAWAIVERHQPYVRGKRKGPTALGLLEWFNRIDKHRAIHNIVVRPHPFQRPRTLIEWDPSARMVEPPTWEIPITESPRGKAIVACYRFDPSGPEPNVRVKRVPTFIVGFGDAPRHLRGVDIGETIAHVRAVIDEFGALLR
jgi:hypothetical protein